MKPEKSCENCSRIEECKGYGMPLCSGKEYQHWQPKESVDKKEPKSERTEGGKYSMQSVLRGVWLNSKISGDPNAVCLEAEKLIRTIIEKEVRGRVVAEINKLLTDADTIDVAPWCRDRLRKIMEVK